MTVNEARDNYRRLPGRRRGFLFGSSVWLGTDYLLLVKSARFREDYKRFYFPDIQAIVMAGAPRFHISTRSAFIGCIWFCLMAIGYASARISPVVRDAYGAVGLLLAGLWAVISAKHSCRCRIYTAVSAE